MENFTINELLKLCQEQIAKGNGEKKIMISNTNAGNAFHDLIIGFTTNPEYVADLTDKGSEYVLLG